MRVFTYFLTIEIVRNAKVSNIFDSVFIRYKDAFFKRVSFRKIVGKIHDILQSNLIDMRMQIKNLKDFQNIKRIKNRFSRY